MFAATPKVLAVLIATACLVPLGAGAQAKPRKSERAMSHTKAPAMKRSERALPKDGQPKGTPPDAAERAMTLPDKK